MMNNFFDVFLNEIAFEQNFNPEEVRSEPTEANWFEISRHVEELPIDFVREFRQYIQWEHVSFRGKDFVHSPLLQEFNREAEERINKYFSLTNCDTGEIVFSNFTFAIDPVPYKNEDGEFDLFFDFKPSIKI